MTIEDDHLEELSRSECTERLGSHGTGRIGVVLDGKPAVFPVNYAVSEGDLFVAIRSGGAVARATVDSAAAFEIDGVDNVYHEGWSVLVVGQPSHITDPDEVAQEVERLGLTPWAGGRRDVVLVLGTDLMTGRRVAHRSSSKP